MFPNIAAVIAEIKAMEAEMKKKGMLRDSSTGMYHPVGTASIPKLSTTDWTITKSVPYVIEASSEHTKEVGDVRVIVVEDKFLPNVGGNPEVQKANRLIMAYQLALKLIEEGLVEFDTTPPVQKEDRWEASAKISVVVKRTSD